MVRAAAAGVGNVDRADGRDDRARRDRRRVGARLRRARGGRRQAPDRPDRRPVRGEEGHGVLPRAARRRPARLAPGPRRGRAHLLGLRDGLGRRRRDRHRRRQGAAAQPRPRAVRGDGLASRRSGCSPSSSPARSTTCSRSAASGRRAAPRSATVTEGDRIRIFDGDEIVGDMPVTLLVDDCPLYDLEPGRARRAGSTATASRALAGDRSPPTRCSRCSRRRRSPRSAGPSSSTTRSCSRARCAGPSRPTPPSCRSPTPSTGDRGLDRRQRPPGRLRPLRGHRRGRARVRREPRLRRRRAARADQLPQLRQPREADGRLAARPLDPGARRRLQRARRPGRRRQRLALQRDRPRADLPDAGRRHGRRAARSAEGLPTAALADGRRDRVRRPVRARRSPARSSRSCAASSAPASASSRSAPSRRRSPRSARPSAPGCLRTAHDVSDGGLACALAECAIAGGVGLQVDLGAAGRATTTRGVAVRRGPRRLRRRRRRRRRSAPLAETADGDR